MLSLPIGIGTWAQFYVCAHGRHSVDACAYGRHEILERSHEVGS